MPKYTIQLSGEAAPFTVGSRETVERLVALFDKMKRNGAFAPPYFTYKRILHTPAKMKPGAPMPFLGLGTPTEKEDTRNALALALEYLHALEEYRRGEIPATELPIMPCDFLDDAAYRDAHIRRHEAAGKEAEEILSLIEEYQTLPGEVTHPY